MQVSSPWRVLANALPIFTWLPRYTREDAAADLVAGVTVGVTLIPQAIAYAALAGVPPQYGLYSALAGLPYILFGTCKDVSTGLTALLALLTHRYCAGTSPDMAVFMGFMGGCIVLLCGLLRLCFLVDMVSLPVVSGFTSAAAITIATSQLKGVLGVRFHATGFLDTCYQLVTHVRQARVWDVLLGVVCIVVLLCLRKVKDLRLLASGDQKVPGSTARLLRKVTWMVTAGRNAAVVVLSATTAFVLHGRGLQPFMLTGTIEPGLPPLALPPFSTYFGNQSYHFVDMCRHLGTGMVLVPIVSIMGNIAIAKAFAGGKVVNATQEMVALGMCNIVGSCFRSLPVNASFSCSAVNNASGVRTLFSNVYSGGIVMLSLTLLTPYFYFIPRAALSAVIMCAVIFMIDIDVVVQLWRINRLDLIPLTTTFVIGLGVGIELGLVSGVVVDILLLLYFSARPTVSVVTVQTGGPAHIRVCPSSGLQFPAVDFVRQTVVRTTVGSHGEGTGPLPVVLDCKHVYRADFTALQGLRDLMVDLSAKSTQVIVHCLKEPLLKALKALKGNKEINVLTSSSKEELLEILAGLHPCEVSKL